MSVCRNKLTWRSLRNLNFHKFLRAAQMCLQWQVFSTLQFSGESHCWSCFCQRYDQKGEFSTETELSWKGSIVCDVFTGNFSQEEIAVLSHAEKNDYLYSLNKRRLKKKNKPEERSIWEESSLLLGCNRAVGFDNTVHLACVAPGWQPTAFPAEVPVGVLSSPSLSLAFQCCLSAMLPGSFDSGQDLCFEMQEMEWRRLQSRDT